MMFTPKNLIALPLLHFPQNSIAILQYFNELESYWNIAIYCNNSINCNLLQYDAIKQRSDWNELLSAGKIYQNNKLVSSAVIRSENANESTQIYNAKIYFLNAQSSPTQVCYFFSTQPFTNYFTLQCYIALMKIKDG